MKKVLFSLFILCSASLAFAQETTLGKTTDNEDITGLQRSRKIMIIPFDTKMYRSDADHEISKQSRITIPQVRNKFRFDLNRSLYDLALYDGSVQSMMQQEPDIQKDLQYIYASIGYKYEPVPYKKEEADMPLKGLIKNPFARKGPEESGIKDGQLHTVADNTEKYMKTQVSNPKMLAYLQEKYGSEIFIFINEMDVQIAPGTPQEQIISNNYQRQLKVHYTVMDAAAGTLSSGAAYAYFPSKMNDINAIVRNTLPAIAREISGSYRQPQAAVGSATKE